MALDILHPVKDAARRLGISVWTLRKKAYERDVASVKIGVKLLIPESELTRLVDEGMRPRRIATKNAGAGDRRNRRESQSERFFD